MEQLQIALALVGSITALTVALLQAIAQARSNRTVERLKAELETQREQQTQYLQAYLRALMDGQENRVRAFVEFLRSVQAMRDLLRIVRENPRSFSAPRLIQDLATLNERVAQCFAEQQLHFGDDVKLAHRVKSHCGVVSAQIASELEGTDGHVHLSESITKQLAELTELHRLLRERGVEQSNKFLESLKVG